MNKRLRRRRRLRDYLTSLIILVAVAIAAAWFARLGEAMFEGRALVVDGDSLEMDDQRIRLTGIDAPELGQMCRQGGSEFACGRRSRDYLRKLTNGRSVTCSGWDYDRYDRLLAECAAGEIDLNRRMVADGWAVSYGGYEAEERDARQRGAGLWAGEFVFPGQWRSEHPRTGGHGAIDGITGMKVRIRAIAGSLWRWVVEVTEQVTEREQE